MKTLSGLSSGKINLTNGNTKMFNVLENNTANDVLLLVKTIGKNIYTVIAGVGGLSSKIEFTNGVHLKLTSSGRFIKHAEGIDVFPVTESGLSDIHEIVKKNKCAFWVFK